MAEPMDLGLPATSASAENSAVRPSPGDPTEPVSSSMRSGLAPLRGSLIAAARGIAAALPRKRSSGENAGPQQPRPAQPAVAARACGSAKKAYDFADHCAKTPGISGAHPAPDWEVYLYAVLAAKYMLREEQAPSSAADEAAFAQCVDAAITGFEASLDKALGLRRKSNRSSAAAELDDVVQVMRDPEDLFKGMCRTLSGCPSSAWPLQHFAFSPTELFDFLHRQLQPKNPYCRRDRFRWKACKAEIGNLLKSGALFCIIEQLDAQQSPSPPERIEYEVALDELGVGSRLMDYNRLLGELGECANGPFV